MGYRYPTELFAQIQKRWGRKHYKHEHVPRLVEKPVVQELIDVVYHASFLTEESRRVWFRVIYINPSEAKLHYDISNIKFVSFDESRPFNVSEMVKLAPAADPTQVLIGVYRESKSSPTLKIWGLIDSGVSWWNFVRGESRTHGGSPPPSGLTVSSKKPGEITVSRGADILFILRQGRIVEPSNQIFSQGPVFEQLNRTGELLHQDVCKKANVKCFDKGGHDEDYPQRVYIDFIGRILNRIREKFHGGTLIMIPDDVAMNDTRLTDRIAIKYPCEYNFSWDALVQQLVRHRKYFDLSEKYEKKSNITRKEFNEISNLSYGESEIDESVENAAGFISALSGVDGAVVITDKLRVLGFGAEITAVSPSLKKVKVITEFEKETGEYRNVELYGTRHRSAFRFCSSFEESIAFIVSQDGDIRIAKRVGSDVLLWSDINLGSMIF